LFNSLDYKRHHHKRRVHQSARESDNVRCAVEGGGESTQEEVDCEQNPRQRVAPAQDEEAEAYRHGYGFLRLHKRVNQRDDEGERGPQGPGEIQETFVHIIPGVIASGTSCLAMTYCY